MSALSDSTEITPGQGSFRSLNITVNSILPAGNESFLPCVPHHSAPIFSLFEVQTVCGPGIHLVLRLSQTLRSQILCPMEVRECEPREKGNEKAERIKSLLKCTPLLRVAEGTVPGPGLLYSRRSLKGSK